MNSNLTKQEFNNITTKLINLFKEAKKVKDDKILYYPKVYEINNILEKVSNDYGSYVMTHIFQSVSIDLGENLGPLCPPILKKLHENGISFKLKNL
jgi:hypothetical protein